MKQVISYWAPQIPDYLPESVRYSAKLVALKTALEEIHFPKSQHRLKKARERLAFDEIFFLQMGVLRQKRDWQSITARIFNISEAWMQKRKAALPFTLTHSQEKALSDIGRRPRLRPPDEPLIARGCWLGENRCRRHRV